VALEVEVKLARYVVVEQQHARRKRNKEERQDQPTPPGKHGKERKEDQNKNDRVQENFLLPAYILSFIVANNADFRS
jgi:heme-binding NEAT domain protein